MSLASQVLNEISEWNEQTIYYVRGAENINEYLEAFNSIYYTLTPEEKKWFGKLDANTIQAGVILEANDFPLATVMVHRFPRTYKDYFWISCATNKHMRGRGLTKRLFEECKTIAKSFDAKVLHWYCDPNNVASNKMAEKLGFQKRHKYRPNDKNQYSYYLSENANPYVTQNPDANVVNNNNVNGVGQPNANANAKPTAAQQGVTSSGQPIVDNPDIPTDGNGNVLTDKAVVKINKNEPLVDGAGRPTGLSNIEGRTPQNNTEVVGQLPTNQVANARPNGQPVQLTGQMKQIGNNIVRISNPAVK